MGQHDYTAAHCAASAGIIWTLLAVRQPSPHGIQLSLVADPILLIQGAQLVK